MTVENLTVQVISDLTNSQRRVSLDWTVDELRSKLEPVTGIPPKSQLITILAPQGNGKVLSRMTSEDHDRRVADFNLCPDCVVKIQDTRPASAQILDAKQLNDPSQAGVEKYEMPKEQYEQRSNSLRAFKQQNRMGRFDDNFMNQQREKLHQQQEIARKMIPGSRALLPGDRRGTVMYVGPVPEIDSQKADGIPRQWIGVRFDEPVGKNDGSIKATRYFSCQPNYGSFVRPDLVEIGDYPPLDDLESEDEDEV